MTRVATGLLMWLCLLAGASCPRALIAQSLTLYGTADAGLMGLRTDSQRADGSRTGALLKLESGIQSVSRLGFRGREDLGDGLTAFFTAELGWNIDDGTGAAGGNAIAFTRRSIVGLQGRLGSVYLGREYSPSGIASYFLDAGGWGFLGTNLTFALAHLQTLRFSNGIYYNTPTWRGLQLRTATGNEFQPATEYASPRGRDRNIEVAVIYDKAPWQASTYYRFGNSPFLRDDEALIKIHQYGVGAAYDFGRVRLMGRYAAHDQDNQRSIVDKVQMLSVGGGVRFGAGEILAQIWRIRFTDVGRGSPITTGLLLAYTYPLSKRTNLYASYGLHVNRHGADLPLATSNSFLPGPGGTSDADARPQAIALGVRMQF